MDETEARRFLRDWQLECGGRGAGPVFKKGKTYVCSKDRAAALDRRRLVEPAKGKGQSFDAAVAAWREGNVAAEEVAADAIVAEADKDTDSVDAGDKPVTHAGSDREKGSTSRKS